MISCRFLDIWEVSTILLKNGDDHSSEQLPIALTQALLHDLKIPVEALLMSFFIRCMFRGLCIVCVYRAMTVASVWALWSQSSRSPPWPCVTCPDSSPTLCAESASLRRPKTKVIVKVVTSLQRWWSSWAMWRYGKLELLSRAEK